MCAATYVSPLTGQFRCVHTCLPITGFVTHNVTLGLSAQYASVTFCHAVLSGQQQEVCLDARMNCAGYAVQPDSELGQACHGPCFQAALR